MNARTRRQTDFASRTKPRVLALQATGGFGGAEVYLVDYCRAVNEFGDSIQIIIDSDLELARRCEQSGIKYRQYGKRVRIRHPHQWLPAVSFIRRAIEEFRPDLILANLPRGAALARLAVPRDPRVVSVLHSPPPPARRVRLAMGLNRRVLTNTHVVADALQSWRPTLDVRVLTPVASTSPNERHLDRDSPPLVSMCSRFQRYKGQESFVYAARKLIDAGYDVNFCLMGGVGGAEPGFHLEIQELVQSLGIEHRISILRDPPDNLRDHILSRSSVFVHPAYFEDFGIAIVEALTFGLPVVTRRTDGARVIFGDQESECVTYWESDSTYDFATSIAAFLSDQDRLDKVVPLAKRLSESHCYGQEHVHRVQGQVNQLIGTQG
jgi:glycosyltransferase involved in cell wall biosynthesis